MISLAAAFAISSIVCTEPPRTFREFFDLYYAPTTGAPIGMRPRQNEAVPDYVLRIMDATAGFQDYRATFRDRCGAAKP